ncbi:Nucleotidylyl transferase [Trametopsis cervina]|nr:Nucleotidylyl transferase [Trametopsis cervina]
MSSRPDEIEVVQKSLILARLDRIDKPPHELSSPIATATSKTVQQLRIVLFSPLFNKDDVERPSAALGTKHWDAVQSTLTYVYVQAMKVAQEMGKILMDVDVLLKGEEEPLSESITKDAEVVFRIHGTEGDASSSIPVLKGIKTIWLAPTEGISTEAAPLASVPTQESDPSLPIFYPVVASGGTFDHLHAGHKILLSMGAWIARDKLIVGVTDDSLLKGKANKDVLQSLSERLAITRNFLEMFKPGIEYYIVPITDVAGPTGWDPNVQAIVVSKETLNGAAAIQEIRRKKGFNSLKTFVIDVISHTEASLDAEDAETLRKTKMSSTFIREWIVKQRS